ncbi:MAG: fumarylacetoacetate hydrolase family protein, partial [Acetobacteraceae bacterium]
MGERFRLVAKQQDNRAHLGPRFQASQPPARATARIACAGGNFADHAAVMAVRMGHRPAEGDAAQQIRKAGFWGFWKLARELLGPDGELVYPARCDRLDYEGEIAIVLGKRGADLRASQ